MSVRLCRWGNSVGLRLPKSLLDTAGLVAGGYVSLRVLDNGDIRVRPVKSGVQAAPSINKAAAASLEGTDSGWREEW